MMSVNNYTYSPQFPPLMKDGFFDPSKQAEQLKGNLKVATGQPNSPTVWTDEPPNHWQRYNAIESIDRYQEWELTTYPVHYAIETATTFTETKGYDATQATTFSETLSATAGASGFGMSAEVTATLGLTEEDTESWHSSTTTTQAVTFPAETTFCMWTLYDTYQVNAQGYCQYEHGGDRPDGFSKEGGPIAPAPLRMAISFYQDIIADPADQYSANIA